MAEETMRIKLNNKRKRPRIHSNSSISDDKDAEFHRKFDSLKDLIKTVPNHHDVGSLNALISNKVSLFNLIENSLKQCLPLKEGFKGQSLSEMMLDLSVSFIDSFITGLVSELNLCLVSDQSKSITSIIKEIQRDSQISSNEKMDQQSSTEQRVFNQLNQLNHDMSKTLQQSTFLSLNQTGSSNFDSAGKSIPMSTTYKNIIS
jgi:hypothetical protein